MGNNLTKLFLKEQRSLKELKGTSIALDITSLIVQSLYGLSHRGIPLRDSKGRITSHIKRILPFLCRLRRYGIDPLVCFDDKSPTLKRNQLVKRMESRRKTLESLQLKSRTIGLTSNQQKVQSLMTLTPQDRKGLNISLIILLQAAGIPYDIMEYQEAQKLCATLKIRGVVQHVHSTDRDVLLYGVPVITDIDFKEQTYTVISYRSNLVHIGVKDREQFLLAVIMSGTDYSSGLKGIGPHKALKIIGTQGVQGAKERLKSQGVPYEQIRHYLQQDPGLMGLVCRDPDPSRFQAILRDFQFNQNTILSYLVDLMGGPQVLERVTMIPPGFEPGSSGPHPDRLPKLPQGTD